MLSAGIVIVMVVVVTGAAVWAKFSWRSLFVSAAVLEFLGFVLLGLPGGALLETIQPVLQRVGHPAISADAAWPAAILVSLLWPVALVPAYLAARSVRAGSGFRGLVALAVLTLTCLIVGVLVYALVT
jgi:hypothetical protein